MSPHTELQEKSRSDGVTIFDLVAFSMKFLSALAFVVSPAIESYYYRKDGVFVFLGGTLGIEWSGEIQIFFIFIFFR